MFVMNPYLLYSSKLFGTTILFNNNIEVDHYEIIEERCMSSTSDHLAIV